MSGGMTRETAVHVLGLFGQEHVFQEHAKAIFDLFMFFSLEI
jgi:hypothetical protein